MNRVDPLGDRAFLATFRDEETAAAWARALRDAPGLGPAEVVTAYRTVGVYPDAGRVDLDGLQSFLAGFAPPADRSPPGRRLTVPVLNDGDDLAEVAGRLGLTPDRVVDEHTGRDYRVFALGFLPGFPYAGYLPDALAGLPRRAEPRTRVPAGSVAIVGRQTAIYPGPSPGGWHLLGRTPLRIVDPEAAAFPIQAGDLLRFEAIGPDEFEARRGELLGS